MELRTRVLSILGAGIIRLCGSTWRVRTVAEEQMEAARVLGPRTIYAFWHGRMLVLSYAYRNSNVHVLASEHRDGELMGQVIRRLGFGHVRGSSTRGGSRAIRELVRKLREGYDLGLTVDGPRGPRHVFKPGPLGIAKLSGCPVVPVAISSKRHWQLTSWDHFQWPWPFTRAQVMFGAPVSVPRDADPETLERMRRDIQNKLQEMTALNDESVCK
jgi:lysophospholipid acyltransferase (LPLAT)-like uncharacterized protein